MKTKTKIALGAAGAVVSLLGGAASLALWMKPAQRPALKIQIERTPERVERGRYLVTSVFPCMTCHSKLDSEIYGSHTVAGTLGAGGDCFDRTMGFPGKVCPSNITPDVETGIGSWTDGEILRAMREGVDKDGNGLFPAMPYDKFREMPDEDAFAVVAYLRTLEPIKHRVEPKQIDFPVNVLSKLAPKPLEGPVAAIDRKDRMAYGKYLTSACHKCHTPVDSKNRAIPGKDFAGGREFVHGPMRVRSANLTFDETGQGGRTKEQFLALFAVWRGSAPAKVAPQDNTMMPWRFLSGMTDEDLGIVYDYLAAQPRVSNNVVRRPPPPLGSNESARAP
jgi:hypothetical protein